MWFAVVWWWFWANMAGQRNKNAFKFLLQLLVLSQKHILEVKKVVWGGLEVFFFFFFLGGGGGGGWFGVFSRTREELMLNALLCSKLYMASLPYLCHHTLNNQ